MLSESRADSLTIEDQTKRPRSLLYRLLHSLNNPTGVFTMSSSFPFMELPLELRNNVYFEVLGGRRVRFNLHRGQDTGSTIWRHCTRMNIPTRDDSFAPCGRVVHSKLDVAVCFVSKAMSAEAIRVHYSTNLSIFDRAALPGMFAEDFAFHTATMRSTLLNFQLESGSMLKTIES